MNEGVNLIEKIGVIKIATMISRQQNVREYSPFRFFLYMEPPKNNSNKLLFIKIIILDLVALYLWKNQTVLKHDKGNYYTVIQNHALFKKKKKRILTGDLDRERQ